MIPFPATSAGLKWASLLAGLAILVGGASATFYWGARVSPPTPAPLVMAVQEATEPEVRALCSKCHAYPPPTSMPRAAWPFEVRQAYNFIQAAHLPGPYPSLESVSRYYESRAPVELPSVPLTFGTTTPVAWGPQPVACPLLDSANLPCVTSVQFVNLTGLGRPDLLVCDAWSGQVLLCQLSKEGSPWKSLAKLRAPATACVVDLDGDGIMDLIVADLGELPPTDFKLGQVVWLRGRADGSFTPIVLATGLGRVADVQAADFRGSGKLDLVVAAFGWRKTGEVLLLENHTTDWATPQFRPRILDKRHGAIHVCVADLNGDGRPDFVALIAQEHEEVVAFLNQGDGAFRKETIFKAPHPAFGCSGIQLVDLNKDGNIDVLLTNGDTLDSPFPIRPYHGVRWLENKGTFPFREHLLAAMPGVMRAVAADVDGDGDLDIVAVSFLPEQFVARERRRELDSVVLLEQTAPGKFTPHSLEKGAPDHVCCAVGDWLGTGKVGLVVGNLALPGTRGHKPPITLWGPRPTKKQVP